MFELKHSDLSFKRHHLCDSRKGRVLRMHKQFVAITVCFAAVIIALAPLPTFAKATGGFSLESLSAGIEFNSTSNAVDDTTTIAASARIPFLGGLSADVTNSVDKVKLTQLLTRVAYQFNGHFTPYLLLGVSSLSFDDKYAANLDNFLKLDTSIPYAGGMSLGYGLGIGGVLMDLPEKLSLTYGVRTFSFSSSDDTAVPPEDISSLLAAISPVANANFSTDVSFRTWDFDLTLKRKFQLDRSFSITPQLGYHHASIAMATTTSVEYSPGNPYFVKGSFDRSISGNLSSVILGVSTKYKKSLEAALQLAVGDVTGVLVAVSYGF